jgi:hypothetical protein
MKILLYTGYRTGSNSFGEWISIQLNLPYYHEPFNPNFDIKNFSIEDAGDCIIKIPPDDGFDYENLKIIFDKKIILYRENTREQAESIIWANEKQLWHNGWHTNTETSSFINAYYTIPNDWLDTNAGIIESTIDALEIENEELKLLKDGLHITYEELYYSDKGIKKVEDYIGFKAKTKFNSINKLRNGFIKKSLT